MQKARCLRLSFGLEPSRFDTYKHFLATLPTIGHKLAHIDQKSNLKIANSCLFRIIACLYIRLSNPVDHSKSSFRRQLNHSIFATLIISCFALLTRHLLFLALKLFKTRSFLIKHSNHLQTPVNTLNRVDTLLFAHLRKLHLLLVDKHRLKPF
ncbi:hypothetical protein BpHYR1_027108 [Brachionus plicatilis]|uniref:Uncharacterized protein n=1 Tax=Brachionus plicatilis TaxID=10195 RepID=A0A3M7QX61_BRAPC|nr:hypothetical protein BpHYR1_027108 [Brachionus plicatilis]